MAKKRGGAHCAGILCMKMGYFYEGGGRLLVAQDSISIESELYKLLNLAKRNCVAYFSQCSAPSFPSHSFVQKNMSHRIFVSNIFSFAKPFLLN